MVHNQNSTEKIPHEESIFDSMFHLIKDIENIIPHEFGDDPRIVQEVLGKISKIRGSLTPMLNSTTRLAYQQPWYSCFNAISRCESFVLEVMRGDRGSETNSRTLRSLLQEISSTLNVVKAQVAIKQ